MNYGLCLYYLLMEVGKPIWHLLPKELGRFSFLVNPKGEIIKQPPDNIIVLDVKYQWKTERRFRKIRNEFVDFNINKNTQSQILTKMKEYHISYDDIMSYWNAPELERLQQIAESKNHEILKSEIRENVLNSNLDIGLIVRYFSIENIARLASENEFASVGEDKPYDYAHIVAWAAREIFTKIKYKNDFLLQVCVYNSDKFTLIISPDGAMLFDPDNQKHCKQNFGKIFIYSKKFIEYRELTPIRAYSGICISNRADIMVLHELFSIALEEYQSWKDRILRIRPDFEDFLFRNTPRHRTPHCWECCTNLDNDLHIICKDCGWIICPHCFACRKRNGHQNNSPSDEFDSAD